MASSSSDLPDKNSQLNKENPHPSDDEDDNSLNSSIFSKEFDPLSAIYSPESSSSSKGVIHDNVEKFVSVIEKRREIQEKKKAQDREKKNPQDETAAVASSSGISSTLLKRQFNPEQLPIERKRKKLSNVWTNMEKQGAKGGPMSLLQKAVVERVRIKVYIRGINYIRGTATGYLVAYDKHWNLALTDVDESFKRRRFPKETADADSEIIKQFDDKLSVADKKENVGNSVVRIVKNNRRWEFCERHSPQLLLRGEHVSHINLLN